MELDKNEKLSNFEHEVFLKNWQYSRLTFLQGVLDKRGAKRGSCRGNNFTTAYSIFYLEIIGSF